jgi:hypothetical protein
MRILSAWGVHGVWMRIVFVAKFHAKIFYVNLKFIKNIMELHNGKNQLSLFEF